MNIALLVAAIMVTQPAAATPSPARPGPIAETTLSQRRTIPLATLLNTLEARDALARVAYAEAGNQGESGLAAVVYTVINRLTDGRWGSTVEAVVDAPHQFEPVMRVGGTWRRLPPVTAVQEATIHTIVGLALQGRLPDLTGGARYFQNRKIVADRAAAGAAPLGLVGFGGAEPSAQIGDHTFYPALAPARAPRDRRHRRGSVSGPSPIFFGGSGAADQALDPMASSIAPDW
jgi:hypothetical protein